MKEKQIRKNGKKGLKKSPVFLIALLNFLIIVTILIYIIYLRFIPYETITYDGYAVSGKDLVNNLLNSTFDVQENVEALEVKDQDEIYKNIKSYYVGADKTKNINLDYPIYVNDTLALYNLSADTLLYTDTLKPIEGYAGFTLTSGALYNANTLERADYHDYILMKNSDNMYINTKEIKIETVNNKYTIKMNSIINFTDEYITYYSLKDKNFVYGKILDIDMDSKVIIKDYNKEYTYKEFLIGLDIIKEDVKEPVEEEQEDVVEKEENKKEIPKEENKIIIEKEPENVIEEEPEKPVEEEPVQPDNGNGETKWQKPTVSSTDFVPNVYTATTEISIFDPSGAINKAITYTFYKDGEIAFRASALSSGTFKVTKLIPETKYNVIGTYQYKNENGGIIEVKFLDQEFKTLNTKNIKPIDLSFENGQIYSKKIEIKDLSITSDITDEAIYGVDGAKIFINNVEYSISTSMLRNILNGKKVTYQSEENLKSSTKYKYEIKFYDTAGNEMKLKNNIGSTVTSKAEPVAKVRLTKQKITSVELTIQLTNDDNVDLSNYRYVITNNNTGEIIKKGKITDDKYVLNLNDLDPKKIYTVKIYADFDIEDGNGYRENQQIGNASFATESLDKLGSLKLEINCNEENDIKNNQITFKTKINTSKTDSRLIDILTQIEIKIQNDNFEKIILFDKEKIQQLTQDEGITTIVDGLESNTKYYVEITAKARQGEVEEKVKITYTFKSFTTRKKAAEMAITNIVEGNNFIDFDIQVTDIDAASLNGIYFVELHYKNNLVEEKEIVKGEITRCYFDGLNKNEEYTIKCTTKKYNETNNEKYQKTNYQIGQQGFKTYGLSGKIELLGLNRETNGSNLIDVESYNKWYSKCFDVITTKYNNKDQYGKDDIDSFTINSIRDYGKTYENGVLTLKTNQCYVYDFKDYIGKEITLSFDKATVTDNSMTVYVQEGKEIGKKLTKIDNLESFESTFTVPKDGYLGFYLEGGSEIKIENLQATLGEKKSKNPYTYDLKANLRVNFTDFKHITYDKDANEYRYYIKLVENEKTLKNEIREITEVNIENARDTLDIEKPQDTSYVIQLIAKYEISPSETREYILDEVSFEYNSINCYEIKSISDKEEFKDIQPYGNYIILDDLNLTESSSAFNESQYTFGNDKITFNGSIDFNGKTITKDVYKRTSYMFYKIGPNAKIKNLVIDLKLNNQEAKYNINEQDGTYGVFLYNEGIIDNLKLTLTECNNINQRYIGLVGYENKGTINKFIIKLEKTLYGTQYVSGCCLYSYGTIQNGYMYASKNANIKITYDITGGYDSSRHVGGLVYNLKKGGVFQNIYNLTKITIDHFKDSNSYAANMIYEVDEGATARNIYSVEEFEVNYENNTHKYLLSYDNKTEITKGLNIYINQGNVMFSYYFNNNTYENNETNTKQDLTVLNDYGFQNNLLNTNGYTEFNNVKNDVKDKKIYPRLNLNKCMPNQEEIGLKITEDESIIDIVSSEIINREEFNKRLEKIYEEHNEKDEKISEAMKIYQDIYDNSTYKDNVKIAVFNVFDPYGRGVTELKINYIENVTIITQVYSNSIVELYAVLSNPTSYIDEYNIASIISKTQTGAQTKVTFGEKNVEPECNNLGERVVNVSFTKYIESALDWYKIDENDTNGVSGLVQNYKLNTDIDFSKENKIEEDNDSLTINTSPYIDGDFTGTFDGQGHTISNIEIDRALFTKVNNGIENLNISGLNIKTSTGNAGVIGKLKQGAHIINVHVITAKIEYTNVSSSCYVGGLCGYIEAVSNMEEETIVEDCSVNGFEVNMAKNPNSQQWYYIGGIVGNNSCKLNISNCYVQNINVIADDGKNTQGVGGIIGKVSSKTNIENCYTHGNIAISTLYAGGIAGIIQNSETTIKNNYSIVNITGNMTTENQYIGGIAGYDKGSGIRNNLYLGNIYIRAETINNSKRIIGNTDCSAELKNYAYEDQVINGKKDKTNKIGASKLLSLDNIKAEATYKDVFGNDDKDNYDYTNLSNGILPKLKYKDKTKNLPNQEDIKIEAGIAVTKIENSLDSDNNKLILKITFEEELENKEKFALNIENNDLKNIDYDILEDGKTVEFTMKPNKYYDTYKLESISYEEEGETKEIIYLYKIIQRLYKDIQSVDDWINISNDYENYRLVGDINFNINTDTTDTTDTEKLKDICNKNIGRLEGKCDTNGTPLYTISNYEYTEVLINKIKTNIEGINFDKIKVNKSGDYSGVISNLNAPMKNCNFNHIIINGNGELGSYKGIVSSAGTGSSMDNIIINDVFVNGGKSYVGGLCGEGQGNFTNIEGTYVQVYGHYGNIGGLFGRIYGGKIDNAKVYQYSADGFREGDTKTDCLVKGGYNVGGCVGLSECKMYTVTVKHSIITTKGVSSTKCYNIGGCAGYSPGGKDIVSESNEIEMTEGKISSGHCGIGGNIGYLTGDVKIVKSINNKISTSNDNIGIGGCIGATYVQKSAKIEDVEASGCEITGINYVGGAVGKLWGVSNSGIISNVRISDTKIAGTGNNVGGCAGYTDLIIKNAKISGGTTVIGIENVGGICGTQTFNMTYGKSKSYSINGSYVIGGTVKGKNNVGGIVGTSNGTVYASVVDDLEIDATGANVGGLVGWFKGSTNNSVANKKSQNYYVLHSFCTNSKVTGNNNVGGLIGRFKYGNLQYCYVGNTDVLAKTNNAGGLIGYFDNSEMTSIQYLATIKYNYIANVGEMKVASKGVTGGLIGAIEIGEKKVKIGTDQEGKDITTTYGLRSGWISNNLVVTNIQNEDNNCISMGIGQVIQNDETGKTSGINLSEKLNNIYVYEQAHIVVNNDSTNAGTKEKDVYTIITNSDLNNVSKYKDWGFNDMSNRYSFEKGYFPILEKLTGSDTQTYWNSSYLNVSQNKIKTPSGVLNDSATNSIASFSMTGRIMNAASELPEMYAYSVDVDKINIEFSEIEPYTYCEIRTSDGEIILKNTEMQQNIYTLKYDFKTPLIAKISNLDNWYEQEINMQDVQNLLDIVNDEYIYMSDKILYSNIREISGEYLNLYKGQALSTDGNIYDILTMKPIKKVDSKIQVLDEIKPISEFNYDETTIQTFYHCSKIIEGDEYTYKDLQIFINNNEMYLVDGDIESVGDSIIIDSYNNNKYETVLGTDGVLYDLMTQIKYPNDFENKNIIDMTSNVDNDKNIVLVYYSSGKVCAFNYITGETIYSNNVEEEKVSLLSYIVENFKIENVTYSINKKSYLENQNLMEKLEKVSIEQAIDEMVSQGLTTENEQKEENSENNYNNYIDNETSSDKNDNSNSNLKNKYIATYNAKTQSYETYNIAEVLKVNSNKTTSENEKLNRDENLSTYYEAMSTNKNIFVNIGITLFAMILIIICAILVAMYKRNNKENR